LGRGFKNKLIKERLTTIMFNISDPNYFLPIIIPTRYSATFSTGANRPMLIEGVCTKTYEKTEYVVKYKNAERMNEDACARELIASYIANEIGLTIAEPVIININREFTDTLIGVDGYSLAVKSLGKNFGCKYIPGGITFLLNQCLSPKQLSLAESIFAFDVFIANPDRTSLKPNMMSVGDDILVYDHELAFSFVLDIFGRKNPWIVSDKDLFWIKNHYFFPTLKNNFNDFERFTRELSRIDENFWNKVSVLVPEEWNTTNQLKKIQDNLDDLILHRDEFLKELIRVMS
jgi:hypothetical protein